MPDENREKVGQTDAPGNPPNPAKGRANKRLRRRKGKSGAGNQKRVAAPFPKTPLENALAIGSAIQQFGAGQKIRRLTLFEKLDKAPDSGPSRMMITNSGKYGITRGGYQADFLELTELGQIATDPESVPSARRKALFDLGITGIAQFQRLYDTNKGKRLPSPEVMRDQLVEAVVDESLRKECVEVFLENAKFLGILRTLAGAERLVPVEQILEEIPGKSASASKPRSSSSGLIISWKKKSPYT